VQILIPEETGKGQPIGKDWFDGSLKELTDRFGGATSLTGQKPARGLERELSQEEIILRAQEIRRL
jgi:hypothetical protein